MHKVVNYRGCAYQSPNHRSQWSLVLTIFSVYSMKINIKWCFITCKVILFATV